MEKTTSCDVEFVGSGYLTWQFLDKDSAVKRWARELGELRRNTFSGADWDIAGHAVMLEAEDSEDVREMLPHIAGEAGMQLHLIDNDQITANFPAWLDAIELDAPSIIYLAPGHWLGREFEEHPGESALPSIDPDTARQFRQSLVAVLSEQLASCAVVFVTVVKSFTVMDPVLRRAGLFDRRIGIAGLANEGLAKAFVAEMGSSVLAPSITQQPERLAWVLRHEYSDRRRRALMQKAMQRLAWKEKRLLEFDDLLRFTLYGTSEVDTRVGEGLKKRRDAIHEAGHALISHLDSKEHLAPEYCSVLHQDEQAGIMMSSCQAHELVSDDLSYSDMAHKVRVLLGGRAAEHLILGPTEVSAKGSMSDLERATRLAGRMFALWGIAQDFTTDLEAGANLAVVLGDATPNESAHAEVMVRKFLQTQFVTTVALLRQNRLYLDRIVEALIERSVLFQRDFDELRIASHDGSKMD